ncbi:hypothetical protein N9D31_02740 [Oligoflexaceae bacterium]|nr:hypothetical protein [Oligoflexaceae bacterium]
MRHGRPSGNFLSESRHMDQRAKTLVAELNALEKSFEKQIDTGLIIQLAERWLKNPASCVGEGTHWRTFRMEAPDLSLAIKIPQACFGAAETNLKVWKSNMAKLNGQRIDLIPPFRVIPFRDQALFVMPYMSHGTSKMSPQWLPLDVLKQSCESGLSALGLRNFDILQIGTVKGIPFVFDLSDIRAIETRSENNSTR